MKKMSGNPKKHCGWCEENNYRCSESSVVATCDFRTLTRSKEAVVARLTEEKKFLESLKKNNKLDDVAVVALDRVSGMNIMIKYLEEDHKMTRKQIMKEIGFDDLKWSEKMKLMLKVKAMSRSRGK